MNLFVIPAKESVNINSTSLRFSPIHKAILGYLTAADKISVGSMPMDVLAHM
jgi:hypothetical protein